MSAADAPKLVKALLVPLDGTSPDLSNKVEVQFNPTSLKISLENEIKADSGSKNKKTTASQHIEKSSSSLAVELLFDTSVPSTEGAVEDVREKTQKIAERFMKGSGQDEKTPQRVRLQWGTFQFDGIVASYAETIDFFSPEGVPLRAQLALTIKEDKFQFAFAKPDKAPEQRKPPVLVGSADQPLHDAVQRAKKDPRDWRGTALANGVENPRLPGAGGGFSFGVGGGISGGIGVSASIGVTGGAGFSIDAGAASAGSFRIGASATLGTHIPGAFVPLPPRPGTPSVAAIRIGFRSE